MKTHEVKKKSLHWLYARLQQPNRPVKHALQMTSRESSSKSNTFQAQRSHRKWIFIFMEYYNASVPGDFTSLVGEHLSPLPPNHNLIHQSKEPKKENPTFKIQIPTDKLKRGIAGINP